MYTPSIKYFEYIDQSKIRKPKSKIIVDGKEYTGETSLKTYPKINHFTSDLLGVFPSKTCEFEIYNKDGTLNLHGKEVTVYRALEIDGTVEWIPMGLFSGKNEDIVSNSTSKTIMFKGYDRTLMFDVPFNPLNHTYPCTLGAFAKRLCENHSMLLETESFPFCDLILNQSPAVASNITERELISRIAELGGCIAQISRSGGLQITKPIETEITVLSEKYKSFSYEKLQKITKVIISQADSEDVSKIADSETIGLYGTVVYNINDNPFIIDRQSEVIFAVAAEIIGMPARAFVLNDIIDDFLFDLNDIITVKDKTGNEIKVVLRSLQSQSRIKSNFSAEAFKDFEESKSSLAGSHKQQIEQQKEALKTFEEQIQKTMQGMSQNINNALGLYSTEKTDTDGSKVIYFHDKTSLETSTYIFTANAEGFAWVSGSGCWNGGNPNWQYGVDSEGGGILSTLLVRELTANVIKTGVLKSVNSPNTFYDLDKGEFISSSSKSESVVDVITEKTITRVTRWESIFKEGVFTLYTYVNDILLYTMQTDFSGTSFDQSYVDKLDEDKIFELTVPLNYYTLKAPTREIYLKTLNSLKQISNLFSGGFFNIEGNGSFASLGKNALKFIGNENVTYYSSTEANVPKVIAGNELTVRGASAYGLGAPDGIITIGEYLRDYKIPGVFTVETDSIAQALCAQENSDIPCNIAGKLIVSFSLSNSSSEGKWQYITQEYHPYLTNEGYYSRNLLTESNPDIWRETPWIMHPAFKSEPADYPVKIGTEGIWEYEQWASGKARCYCKAYSTQVTPWDSMSVVCNVELPFEFIGDPIVNCSGGQFTAAHSYIQYVAGTSVNVSAYIKCIAEPSEEFPCWFYFDVKGRWK